MERKEGVGPEKRENGRRISGKKRERKESKNYKTENGRKLVMEDKRKERRKEKER